MSRFSCCLFLSGILLVSGLSVTGPVVADARYVAGKKGKKGFDGPSRVLVLDGKSVHNVGQLQMHLLNWGEWGSRPGTAEPYSLAPSAQWPSGSGVEYLFSAGLWVGALKSGIPAVSTASLDREFRPSQDPRDIIYETTEGSPAGNRPPSARADDDGDGLVDEEWLDGHDNDGDGKVDEDFAAISTQMMTCQYTDDQPIAREIFPEHNPLNILVRQQSYQWDGDNFDDFVAVEYHITNIGSETLEDVYLGMFVDADAGPRTRSNYWEDDLVARTSAGGVCTVSGPALVDVAYTYDADTDDGATTGYFGVTFLGHTTDPTGGAAPSRVGLETFAHFAGEQVFGLGGDPNNDFERYELLAQRRVDRNADLARDYRMLVGTGPFRELPPDSTLVFQLAFVIGEGVEATVANAANAFAAFTGDWFDLDRDPLTGVSGRETPVYGPAIGVWVDSCRKSIQFNSGCDLARLDRGFNKPVPVVPAGDVLWTNADCETECTFKSICNYTERDSFLFRSGVGGRESHVNWILSAVPPPAPRMRVVDHARNGVVLYWDNFSETVPDLRTQKLDFEGYRVWRADNWTRPLGTSADNGPPANLWSAIFQADRINGFGDDSGLNALRYEPLENLLSPARKRDFLNLIKQHLSELPGEEPPCPQGVTQAVCDTIKALARAEMGLDGGRRYYRYTDRSMQLGRPYFYAVVAFDNDRGMSSQFPDTQAGDPASNFVFVEPKSAAQPAFAYDEDQVYVVPNPATRRSMEAWRLDPTNDDPSGIKVEFRNLPASRGTIRIYTLSGDLVKEILFDGRAGVGTAKWDLVSRNGQDVTSGVYLYAIEFADVPFERVVKKFTIIR
ncbi:MAG: hypothetical protein ACE5EO_03205 [Candidatus Krumholzibacteriia bacterium]